MTTIYSNNETININPTDDLVLYKEEFINSRIEKFLYAICALDFDDLPTPLSRIEELYKCLATGLPAPTFVPQSRVEKYLMAILGGYDASALPAPQSRTEVLLNKILLGDTDLSNIEWLKSRYEFLLAYIAKSGEISSGLGDNFEYLQYIFSSSMYSIDGTKEVPIKSAVLKGQTLVNLMTNPTSASVIYMQGTGAKQVKVYDNNKGGMITFVNGVRQCLSLNFSKLNVKVGNKYLLELDCYNGTSNDLNLFISNTGYGNTGVESTVLTEPIQSKESKHIKAIFTMTESLQLGHNLYASSVDDEYFEFDNVRIIEYRDGMENWDIPYFEGMQSVKMPVLTTTGKNLFNKGNMLINCALDPETGEIVENWANFNTSDFIKVEKNKPIFIPSTGNSRKALYDVNKNHVKNVSFAGDKAFVTDIDGYIRTTMTNIDYDSFQIEYGTQATTYEPYKTNILTVNEPVELRGIGDVKDELNLLTGELTQRIGEVVFDGSLYPEKTYNTVGKTIGFYYPIDTILPAKYSSEDVVRMTLCDKLKIDNHECHWREDIWKDEEFISSTSDGRIAIRLLTTKADSLDGLCQYLSQNPIRLQYVLKTESIKTVDLSAVDQDGSKAKLSSFEDITHVTVTSEGILPDVELEVATKIEEVLNTMSLRMDDISTTQATLNETVNTQSENVDATMIATTEIYEGLL